MNKRIAIEDRQPAVRQTFIEPAGDDRSFLKAALLARYAGMPTEWKDRELFDSVTNHAMYIVGTHLRQQSDNRNFRSIAFRWAVKNIHLTSAKDLVDKGFIRCIIDSLKEIDFQYAALCGTAAVSKTLDRLVYFEVHRNKHSAPHPATHPVVFDCVMSLTDSQRQRILGLTSSCTTTSGLSQL